MKLGEKIWQLREEKGLSQEALAEIIDVSRQTISNWENDKATPDAYKLKQLCDVFDVKMDELWDTEESNFAPQENNSALPQKNVNSAGRKNLTRRILLFVLGLVSVLLIAIAIAMFALPEEKTQEITSTLTFTPTMGGILLLALAAILAAVAVISFKKK